MIMKPTTWHVKAHAATLGVATHHLHADFEGVAVLEELWPKTCQTECERLTP